MKTKKSRSDVYTDALREYLRSRDPEEITDAMNAACEAIGPERDRFAAEAARRTLSRVEW